MMVLIVQHVQEVDYYFYLVKSNFDLGVGIQTVREHGACVCVYLVCANVRGYVCACCVDACACMCVHVYA